MRYVILEKARIFGAKDKVPRKKAFNITLADGRKVKVDAFHIADAVRVAREQFHMTVQKVEHKDYPVPITVIHSDDPIFKKSRTPGAKDLVPRKHRTIGELLSEQLRPRKSKFKFKYKEKNEEEKSKAEKDFDKIRNWKKEN